MQKGSTCRCSYALLSKSHRLEISLLCRRPSQAQAPSSHNEAAGPVGFRDRPVPDIGRLGFPQRASLVQQSNVSELRDGETSVVLQKAQVCSSVVKAFLHTGVRLGNATRAYGQGISAFTSLASTWSNSSFGDK